MGKGVSLCTIMFGEAARASLARSRLPRMSVCGCGRIVFMNSSHARFVRGILAKVKRSTAGGIGFIYSTKGKLS